MPSIALDPTNLKANEGVILGKLLSQIDIGTFLDPKETYPIKLLMNGVEIEYQIKLKLPMYKESDKNSRVLLKEIGSGGEGTVYLADTVTLDQNNIAKYKEDTQHERVVKVNKSAVKLVLDWDNYAEDVKETSEKMITHKRKVQENVPHLHAKDTLTKTIRGDDYWVSTSMHKMPGKTLANILANESQKLTPELHFEITRKFLLALKQLHDAGISHADIKPANVMLDIDYKSNTVKSLKIIDTDLSKLPGEIVGPGTLAYKTFDIVRDKRVDIYAAGISLLETWGASSKDIKRPEDYSKASGFIPKANLPERDFVGHEEAKKSLTKMFQGMIVHQDQRAKLDDLVLEIDSIELNYILENLKLNKTAKEEFIHAHAIANEARITLEKMAKHNFANQSEFVTSLSDFVEKTLYILREIKSPLAVMEFTKMLDINALRGCDDVAQIEKKLKDHLSLFESNLKTLQNMGNTQAHRFLKKANKCKTIDEIIEFNNLYTDKINRLTSNNNAPIEKKDIKKELLDDIRKASTYDNLVSLYTKIKNYEKLLKFERDDFYSTFGKYGITDSWQEIMKDFQQKAYDIARNEMEQKAKDYPKMVDLTNKYQVKYLCDHMQERYNKFFTEKTGRIIQSSFGSYFDNLLQPGFSSNQPSLKLT